MSAPALTRPTAPPLADPHAGLPANAIGRRKSSLEIVTLYVIVAVPFLALAAVVPAVWGWGLTWLDVGLAVGFYYLTLLGVTVGYHRHFTHGSFKAKRPLKLALAAAGSPADVSCAITDLLDGLDGLRWGTRTRTETARLQRPAGCRLPHPPPTASAGGVAEVPARDRHPVRA